MIPVPTWTLGHTEGLLLGVAIGFVVARLRTLRAVAKHDQRRFLSRTEGSDRRD